MILLVHWPPHEMDCATTIWAATDGTVRVTQNNTVNVTQIYGGWECRSSRNYCKDIVSPHSCYCAFTQIYAVARPVSWTLSLEASWRHGFTAAWKSGGEAGATHVQISWISAWIPSEVTRTFFFDLPIWDSNSSSFSCRSFSSQREPTVVGSIMPSLPWIIILGSLMMRFANDFHSWLRHSWKLLANRLTRDPEIVIHGNSCIILYFLLPYRMILWDVQYLLLKNQRKRYIMTK